MKDKEKTVEELTKENEDLLSEIAKLKESVSKKGKEKELLDENDSVKEELKKYKELCEKQTKDLADMTKFTQQILLDYGVRAKDNKYYDNETEKDDEQTKLDTANEHLKEYFEQFDNKGE